MTPAQIAARLSPGAEELLLDIEREQVTHAAGRWVRRLDGLTSICNNRTVRFVRDTWRLTDLVGGGRHVTLTPLGAQVLEVVKARHAARQNKPT